MAISLAAAAYLEMALVAKRDGDEARFAGCVASIDEESWQGLRDRFSEPLGWMADSGRGIAAPATGPAAIESGRWVRDDDERLVTW